MILAELLLPGSEFFAIRIRFIEADPDPADRNETDPNGSGSATLLYRTQNLCKHPENTRLSPC